MSLKSWILILPAGVLPTAMSKKTIGRGAVGAGVDMTDRLRVEWAELQPADAGWVVEGW